MGYVGLVTGLSNVRIPGDIPFEEWDSWHTLIVNDELSRVVCLDPLERLDGRILTCKGLHRSVMGSWRRQQYRSSSHCKLRHSSSEG